ncbi:MAG TPA: threonine--tRNA ligase [Candidatus Paceibacterota bacterium]|nr:threonine--tRNA ligase [Verrucomicrobiota bacterium]HRY47790.1 threonine--tRNA ligase [Candidatus Paceibacterota bacterium]HSA00465.1 threonine--tRNA ligase [Candidatus Paceibacterota bacterium]
MSEPAKESVERKSLDERNRMSDLERLRHSCSHIMAAAVLRLWPEARLDIGPPTDEGFYYDFDLPSHRFTPEDFPRIEEEMRKIAKENHVFERSVKTRDEALEFFRNQNQRFKLERLSDIPDGEPISFFSSGEFVDLCAGPHVMRTGNVKAFKLLRVAAAYYRGNEKNPQLQRIYGTAFPNKTELEAWLKAQEEARKRDHRKIGQDMQLFVFDSEYVGPGLPLWMPNGAVLIEELERLAKESEFAAGYLRVRTPHLAREKMYLTSGHLPYYAESMYPPMFLVEEKAESNRAMRREEFRRAILDGELTEAKLDVLLDKAQEIRREEEVRTDRYYLKAMNCPHHHRIFAAAPRSYRDLPMRLAEYGTCYRYEQSGELMGLMRVRSMQMNDAHIYCSPEQFAAEFQAVNEMYLKYFQIFGLGKYLMRFSTHDPAKLGQKFVDNAALWKKTEDMVRQVLKESAINYIEVPNEAAFYGPKIDVQVWSVSGREFTIATNQVDFAVPDRFGLVYRDRDNTDKSPLCIHRAPLGTHERFLGFLIEHYAGNFPLWLAPEQVRVLPVTPDQIPYAEDIVKELRNHLVRASLEFSNDKLQGRILRAEEAKTHTMLVVGQKEMQTLSVSVRVHGKGSLGVQSRADVVANLLRDIRERRG